MNNIRNTPSKTRRTLLACLLFASARSALGDDTLERLGEPVERQLMARLAQVQQLPDSRLAPFTTDGCSGGLSVGWEHMAKEFPQIGSRVGNQTPWEDCCVTHDRAYWQGRGTHGFEARRAADRALRQCVIDSGHRQGPAFAAKLGVPEKSIEHAFDVAADLMYAAVRVGGIPCSTLPWRWGYGWPQCTPLPAPPAEPTTHPTSTPL